MSRPNVNYSGPEWGRVEEWLADELYETYRRLSGLTLDERETQQLRGRISLITMMLDFRKSPLAADRAAN